MIPALGRAASAVLSLGVATASAEVAVVVAGDVLVVEPPPVECRERLDEALAVIREADLAFANLESSLAATAAAPASTSGGLWLRAGPGAAEWLASSGLDVLSLANNHTWDWGPQGAAETRQRLDDLGLVSAGSGPDASSAWSASVTSAKGLRVAVIAAVCAPPDDPGRARDAEPGFPARPGMAQIGTRRVVTLSAAKTAMLRALLREAGIPTAPRGRDFDLGGFVVRQGRFPDFTVELDPTDVSRLEAAVTAAAAAAEIVLVSLHCAEGPPTTPAVPEALRQLAASVVRAGADAVVVHGPHHLRGVEWLAPNAAALYGLGSVALQHRLVAGQPREAWARWGLADGDDLQTLVDRVESAMGPERELWSSLAATLVFDGSGRLSGVRLNPWDLAGAGPTDPCRGLPAPAEGERRREILEAVRARSAALGGMLEPAEHGLMLVPPRQPSAD